MKKPIPNQSRPPAPVSRHFLAFPLVFLALGLVELPRDFARADSGETPRPATALCTDLRAQAVDPAAPTVLSHYTGREIVTQAGDQVTVQYLPDRLAGFSGAVVAYERITRRDAQQLGFRVETGMAVYMLHGDEGLPSEYVLLPEHFAELASARFEGLYGACDEAGDCDASRATIMSCELK